MASSQPSNNGHSSSKKNIPGTMTFDMRPSSTKAAPLVRRPMIACESCRVAKVKCNGRQPCNRCKSRGTSCIHTPSPSRRDSVKQVQTVSPPASDRTSVDVPTPVNQNQMQLDDPVYTDNIVPQGFQEVDPIEWPNESFVTWLGSGHNTVSRPAINPELICYPDLFHSLPDAMLHEPSNPPSTSPNTYFESLSTESKTSPSQKHSADECPCRVTLVALVPKLESIIQQGPLPRLDKILNLTEEVVQKCKASLNCPTCQIRPADLVCIANVFQQTAACFEHISKSGLNDTSMKMGLGDYQLSSVTDVKFKRMLVLNLVKEAGVFLDSMDDLSRVLFMSPPPEKRQRLGRSPVCLNQVNLAYVREVVMAFKKFFKLINETLDTS